MNTAIVGWGHIPFGRREDDVESMLLEVTGEALVSAGVDASDVDAVYLGWFNGGMSEQDFGSSLVMNGFEGLRYKPATRVENACATGSAAVYHGERLYCGRAWQGCPRGGSGKDDECAYNRTESCAARMFVS